MSDPLNPPCVACSVRPAKYGKPFCIECEKQEEKSREESDGGDRGDEYRQEDIE